MALGVLRGDAASRRSQLAYTDWNIEMFYEYPLPEVATTITTWDLHSSTTWWFYDVHYLVSAVLLHYREVSNP